MDRLRILIWMKGTAKLVSLHWSIVLIRLVQWITLHDWSDAIDRLMAYLMACYCLCVGVVDWRLEWLTEHIIDDRPWNPRNPNSMLRNILSHHAPPVGWQKRFVCVWKKFCCRRGPGGGEPGTGWWVLLNYWMSLPVPEFGREFFLHLVEARRREPTKHVKKISSSRVRAGGLGWQKRALMLKNIYIF